MSARTLSSCVLSSRGITVLEKNFYALSIGGVRHYYGPKPRLRNPSWFTRQTTSNKEEYLTAENREFIQEVVHDKTVQCLEASKSIKGEVIEWQPHLQRTGIIAKKIGVYPLWRKDGTRILTTLLQVPDNHIIKYTPPDQYVETRPLRPRVYNKKGCLLVGAEIGDPTKFTKDYTGLFKGSGVLPTQWLKRFFVSPEAAPPVGTSLTVRHFQIGNYVDVRGVTMDRGFQGVMKRHGFKGMPATHGATKTHRRGGNIGGGGEKARVWPGTKMPGHMGNRYRIAKGLKIWRINYKYNVMWVSGQAIPGEINKTVTVFDTKLPLRKPKAPLPFPTYYLQDEDSDDLVEDVFDEEVHSFGSPTIVYEPTK